MAKKLLIQDQGKVNVMFTRKFSVAPYETFDITVGGEVSIKPGQTTNEALKELRDCIRKEYSDVIEVMSETESIGNDVD